MKHQPFISAIFVCISFIAASLSLTQTAHAEPDSNYYVSIGSCEATLNYAPQESLSFSSCYGGEYLYEAVTGAYVHSTPQFNARTEIHYDGGTQLQIVRSSPSLGRDSDTYSVYRKSLLRETCFQSTIASERICAGQKIIHNIKFNSLSDYDHRPPFSIFESIDVITKIYGRQTLTAYTIHYVSDSGYRSSKDLDLPPQMALLHDDPGYCNAAQLCVGENAFHSAYNSEVTIHWLSNEKAGYSFISSPYSKFSDDTTDFIATKLARFTKQITVNDECKDLKRRDLDQIGDKYSDELFQACHATPTPGWRCGASAWTQTKASMGRRCLVEVSVRKNRSYN